jgi:chemotaxis signal transduction protein
MQLVSLSATKQRFFLETKYVQQIVPHVALRCASKEHPLLCGALNYQGRSMAVCDLSVLLDAGLCARSLGTRILIINLGVLADTPLSSPPELFGLIAEEVTSIFSPYSSAYRDQTGSTPMYCDGRHTRYPLELGRLIPDSLRSIIREERAYVIQ